MTSRVGIVVVGYDSDEVWPSFFDSLSTSSIQPRVVVVENSAKTPSTIPSKWKKKIRLLHRPENPGYGTAANVGADQLIDEVDVLMVCNPDVVWKPDSIEILAKELLTHPTAGIAGPRLMNSDGSTYPSARAFPGVRIGIGHALLGDLWKKNPWTRKYLGHYEGLEPRIVDWLSGACLAIKPQAFSSVGGFDEDFFMFVEDVDLCFRLKKKGWRSLYVPRASITHLGAHSTGPRMVEMVKVHHDSARKFLFRLYSGPLYAPLRTVLRLGLWLRSQIAPLRYLTTRRSL
jgi:N-acetylglucosaminyl-diphospho-decaprenol L-rhamnosyltransferase